MRVEVHKVTVEPTKLFSAGQGFDDFGEPVDFIGYTKEMDNIREAIEDYEEDHRIGLPSIYLKPWQTQNGNQG